MANWDKITGHRKPEHASAPWTHSELREWITSFPARDATAVRWEVVGRSVEGREVWMATLGGGPRRVLAWSQMHGDEPTHTGALCRLIDFLTHSSDDSTARAILSGCTLHLVLMLNPDGAERSSRFNAQGIDVNRDARRLATPEGRILKRLVDEYAPNFGFNLHNQNHRTRVVDQPAPVAMALLVPPRDADNTQTPSVEAAARVAGVIRDSAAPHCDELVTRYDADYMPRAFGEWVQTQDVATVLIEAGWRSDGDYRALEDLHLFALGVALESIATDSYRTADPQAYESLRRPAGQRLFDVLISGAKVPHGSYQAPVLDIGINFSGRSAMAPDRARGVINELGDLEVNGGLQRIDASGAYCLPGRIGLCRPAAGGPLPSEAQITGALRAGFTTLAIPVDLADRRACEAAREWVRSDWRGRVNIALLGVTDRVDAERLLAAVEVGAVAVVCPNASDADAQAVARIGAPLVAESDIPAAKGALPSANDWIDQTRRTAKLLRLNSRGAIGRRAAADLAIVSGASVQSVLVGGIVDSDAGAPHNALGGRPLRAR